MKWIFILKSKQKLHLKEPNHDKKISQKSKDYSFNRSF